MKNDHSPIFIPDGKANRYLTPTKVYKKDLAKLISLESLVVSQLQSYGFPNKKKNRVAREFYLCFTMLKSDAKLNMCQVAHTD